MAFILASAVTCKNKTISLQSCKQRHEAAMLITLQKTTNGAATLSFVEVWAQGCSRRKSGDSVHQKKKFNLFFLASRRHCLHTTYMSCRAETINNVSPLVLITKSDGGISDMWNIQGRDNQVDYLLQHKFERFFSSILCVCE